MVVESLALGPAVTRLGMPAGRLQAMILYSSYALGGGSYAKHVAWLELRAGESVLHCCSWLLRCLHRLPAISWVASGKAKITCHCRSPITTLPP